MFGARKSICMDTSRNIYKDDGSTSSEIKLGRYTFSTTEGTPTPVQDATNYTDQSDEL